MRPEFTILEQLLCQEPTLTWYCAKCFLRIISFHPHRQLQGSELFKKHLKEKPNEGFQKVTQLVSVRIRLPASGLMVYILLTQCKLLLQTD